MRVISGTARGKKLTPVPGTDTRPTTDRVKESVFNIVQTRVRGARVLDLFAGTGQLGVEALSRGASWADFVDSDARAAKIVQKNLEAARVGDRARVHVAKAEAFAASCDKRGYDLIFLDPPYGGATLSGALRAILRFDILSSDGIIICESAAEDEWDRPFLTVREYRYGTIQITALCGGSADTTSKDGL